jgi:hypothetical protein
MCKNASIERMDKKRDCVGDISTWDRVQIPPPGTFQRTLLSFGGLSAFSGDLEAVFLIDAPVRVDGVVEDFRLRQNGFD